MPLALGPWVAQDLLRVRRLRYDNPWEAIVGAAITAATASSVVGFVQWLTLLKPQHRKLVGEATAVEVATELQRAQLQRLNIETQSADLMTAADVRRRQLENDAREIANARERLALARELAEYRTLRAEDICGGRRTRLQD